MSSSQTAPSPIPVRSGRRWFWPALLLTVSGSLLVLLLLVPPPRVDGKASRKIRLQREAQRFYWHELLSLYQPPEEIFTPHGLALLRRIQENYSEAFLPYLVNGSALLASDTFYNPWFDLFILVHEEGGLINSVVLASALGPGETPQLDTATNFWQQVYQRHQAVRLASFNESMPADLSRPAREMLVLTNQLAWPSRLQFTPARVPFDLYLQRPDQSIYCTPTEPGTYIVLNVVGAQLRTNVLVLPPYAVQSLQLPGPGARPKTKERRFEL